MNLADELIDKISINGTTYDLDLWFDTVLRFFELMDDDSFTERDKIVTAFHMLVDVGDDDIDIKVMYETVQQVVNIFIIDKEDEKKSNTSASNKKTYDLVQDAPYIFSSFLQEYGIDLIEQQGKLRWEKFTALISGMRDDTKFKEIIGIRMADIPTGKGSEDEAKRLRELKRAYALDVDQNTKEEEMNAMFNNYLTGGKMK